MLDGQNDELQTFRAEAVRDGCKVTASVRAHNYYEARKMLDDLGMQDYELVDEAR